MNFNQSKTVAVAMSGGVDSSTAAYLMIKQGFNVFGITGYMTESSEQSAENAEAVCKVLGIPHKILDLQEPFKNNIINYFEESYRQGLTPNPCTVCNPMIKWGIIADYARDKLGANYYATGHYAKIVNENNNYKLFRAKYTKKDQSYMLFTLTQKHLEYTIFPLCDFEKAQTRQIAEEAGLPVDKNKESQDVCFICPPETLQSYLLNKFGTKEGDIIELKTGKKIGTHQGTFNYTIGQRKGICIASTKPYYVISINPDENIIYVGFREALSGKSFKVNNINWQQEEYKNQDNFSVMARIRYNSAAQEAQVLTLDEKTVKVEFKEPKFAITPGQAAVFYDINNEYLLGGGWISQS